MGIGNQGEINMDKVKPLWRLPSEGIGNNLDSILNLIDKICLSQYKCYL